ncbi:hypothetical protein Hoch_0083 [Haliangium ochraceum DSM 14365]|uniref:Transmembrane protein n=2 Tax=Haliangium ochraceum TaxID=80816 RepID=D0LGH8_HALO1|nr:hypothetical protein Hoch_0083 [Haliangium ochraceum DSM 14365]
MTAPQQTSESPTIYRDNADALRAEAARLRRRHEQALAAVATRAASVYGARGARLGAGIVLLCAALALPITALSGGAEIHREGFPPLSSLLLAGWLAAIVVYLVARPLMALRYRSLARRPLAPSSDVHADLEAMRRFDPGRHATGLVTAIERLSSSAFLTGVSLLTPFALHAIGALVIGTDLDSFQEWLMVSMIIVGHCHIVLAVMAWRHGGRLAKQPMNELVQAPARAGWRVYRIVLMTSLIPGALLFCMPVALVAVTGLFVPLLFRWLTLRLADERDALAVTRLDALAATTPQG